MTEVHEGYKLFGLLAILISIVAGGYIIWQGPRDKTKSISLHATVVNKRAYLMYACAVLLATIFFYLFCLFWFIPMFHFPLLFTILITTMTLFLAFTVFIPEVGKGIRPHQLVSYGYAAIMLLVLLFIANSQYISLITKIVAGLSGIWMSFIWYLYLFQSRNKQLIKHFLVFQVSYLLAFFLSILAATYIL